MYEQRKPPTYNATHRPKETTMFWIGLLVGWLTAGPLAILAIALATVASNAMKDPGDL